MWAINGNRRVRHYWGQASSLCGEAQKEPLDYVRGVRVRKCPQCAKFLGRKQKREGPDVGATHGNEPPRRKDSN
jgi:hypothetical protein